MLAVTLIYSRSVHPNLSYKKFLPAKSASVGFVFTWIRPSLTIQFAIILFHDRLLFYIIDYFHMRMKTKDTKQLLVISLCLIFNRNEHIACIESRQPQMKDDVKAIA